MRTGAARCAQRSSSASVPDRNGPGAPSQRAMRSAIAAASSWSWVTSSAVVPVARSSVARSAARRSWSSRSSPVSGSSSSSTRGPRRQRPGERHPLGLAAAEVRHAAGRRSRRGRRASSSSRDPRGDLGRGRRPACAARSRRCRPTARCGNSCSSWNTSPMLRRCEGSEVMSRPSSQHAARCRRPAARRSRAAACSCRLRDGPEQRHHLAGRRPCIDSRVEHGALAEAHGDVTHREHRALPAARRRATIDGRGDEQDRWPARSPAPAAPRRRGRAVARWRWACVSRPAAGEERGGAELAERDRGGQPRRRRAAAPRCGGRRSSHHARSGDAPSVAAASRCSGGMDRSTRQQRPHHERRGHQRVTERDQPPARPRQSNGGVSKVMSMPRPMVTADVPSGSINPMSSQPTVAASSGDGQRSQSTDAHADRRRDHCETQRGDERRERVDTEADPRTHLRRAERAPGMQRPAAAQPERSRHEHQQRSEHHHRRQHRAAEHHAPLAGRPCASPRAAAPANG